MVAGSIDRPAPSPVQAPRPRPERRLLDSHPGLARPGPGHRTPLFPSFRLVGLPIDASPRFVGSGPSPEPSGSSRRSKTVTPRGAWATELGPWSSTPPALRAVEDRRPLNPAWACGRWKRQQLACASPCCDLLGLAEAPQKEKKSPGRGSGSWPALAEGLPPGRRLALVGVRLPTPGCVNGRDRMGQSSAARELQLSKRRRLLFRPRGGQRPAADGWPGSRASTTHGPAPTPTPNRSSAPRLARTIRPEWAGPAPLFTQPRTPTAPTGQGGPRPVEFPRRSSSPGPLAGDMTGA